MSKTKITVNNNGSLKIEGDFEIVDPQGNTYGLAGIEISFLYVDAAFLKTSLFAMVLTKDI